MGTIDTSERDLALAGLRSGSSNDSRFQWQSVAIHAEPIIIGIQVALIALVMARLDLFTSGFRRVFYLVACGFLVHHWLPHKLKLQFFVFLSITAMLLALGGSQQEFWDGAAGLYRTSAIVIIGGLLIGICHLPLGFWKRAALLAFVGLLLGYCRGESQPVIELAAAWPVLAGMFMFRIIIYLYDVSTSERRPHVSQSAAYFFLFPNITAPFFPIIDFKTFCRSHYNEAPARIYQRGINWINRGVFQLVGYRIIEQLWSIKASEVSSGSELAQFLITNSFAYLKISGGYHVIIGSLLLFGFNLPESNHRYFLASSFTDYWRRVNIYWKDFVMKIFYYPAYFKLKKHGEILALVSATLFTFFVTWALHLYQTWWIKGSLPVSAHDAIFWTMLALLVLANSLWEMKHGRSRKIKNGREGLLLALQTAGTFAVLSVLWSLWSSGGFGDWLHAWRHADIYTLVWAGVILAAVMVAKAVVEILPSMGNGLQRWPMKRSSVRGQWIHLQSAICLLLIALLAHPVNLARFEGTGLQPYTDAMIVGDSLIGNLAVGARGYYDELTTVSWGDRELWEVLLRTKLNIPNYTGADPIEKVHDYRLKVPKPNLNVFAYETTFQTNRWGMREREVPLAKAPGTFRIAILGSSHTMGWGVPKEKTFASIVEERLIQGTVHGQRQRVEVLNFAFNAYGPLSQISVLDQLAFKFSPNMALLIGHPYTDFTFNTRDLSRLQRHKVPIRHEFLRQVLSDNHVGKRTHEGLADQRLNPHKFTIGAQIFKQIADDCKAAGVLPVYVYLPLPDDLSGSGIAEISTKQLAIVQQAGFLVVNLTDVYNGLAPNTLVQNDVGRHSNAKTHGLVADALYRELTTHPLINLLDRVRVASIESIAAVETRWNLVGSDGAPVSSTGEIQTN